MNPLADSELYRAMWDRMKELGPRVAADWIGGYAPTAALLDEPTQSNWDYAPNFVNSIRGMMGNEGAAQRAELARQTARNMVGATPSDTAWDDVASISSGFLVPMTSLTSAVGNLGRRGLSALVPSGGRAERIAGGVGQFTGEAALGLTLPFRQAVTGPQAVVELGLPNAIAAGSRALVGEQEPQNPFAIPDFSTKPTEVQKPKTLSDLIAPPVAAAGNTNPFAIPDFNAAQEVQQNPFAIPDSDVIEEQDEQTNATKVALAVGGSLAMVLGGAVATRRLANARQLHTSPYVGASRKSRLSNPWTMFKQGFTDRKAALGDALAKGQNTTPTDVEDMKSLASARGTPQAQARIILEHMISDVPLPNSNIQWATPPGVILDTLSRLSPEQFEKATSAVIAGTKLDDLARTRQPVWQGYSNGVRVGPPIPRIELARNIRDARADPVTDKIVRDTQDVFRKLGDYLYEQGVITQRRHNYWRTWTPNFVPTSRDFEDIGFLPFKQRVVEKAHRLGEKILGAKGRLNEGQTESWQRFLPRSSTNPIPPSTMHSPFDLMESYIAQVLRQVQNNNIRKEFIDKALADPALARYVRKTGPDKSNTVSIRRNGVDEHYQILDDAVLDALRNHPALVIPIVNGTRRAISFWNTGPGNPAFALKSAIYETVTHFTTQSKGIGGGPIDAAMKMMGMNKTLSDMIGFDPSFPLGMPVGAAMRIKDRIANGMSRSLQAQINADSGKLLKLLGPRKSQLLADFLGRHYARSMSHFMGLKGGEGSVFLENKMIDTLTSQAHRASPRYFETMSRVPGKSGLAKFAARTTGMLLRSYLAFNEAMYQGVKMTAARGSLPRNWQALPPEKLNKVASEIRQIGGDTTRTGVSPIHRSVASFVPWYNTGVQVISRYGRAAKERPVRLALTTMSLAYLTHENVYNIMNTSAEAVRDFFTVKTPAERASNWYRYNPDGTVDFAIPIDPMLRPMVSMVTEMTGAVLGLTGGLAAEWDKSQGMFEALKALSPITSAPPLLNALAASMGTKLPNVMESIFSDRYEVGMLQKERISGLEDSEKVLNTSVPKELDEIIRSLTGIIGASFLEGLYTFESMRDGGMTFTDAMKSAADFAIEPYRKTATLGSQMWGQTYKNQVRDGTYTFVQGVNQTLKTAMDVAAEFRSPESTGSTPSSATRPGYESKYAGSEPLQFISMQLLGLNKEAQRHRKALQQLYLDRDFTRKDVTIGHSTNTYNAAVNEINTEIKIIQQELADAALAYEDSINEGLKSRGITKPFKINSFKPDEWIQ